MRFTAISLLLLTCEYFVSSRHLLSVYDGWIKEPSPTLLLPQADEQIAVGFHGNAIYLIGGYDDTIAASRTQYNITSATMVTLETISPKMNGYSQYYTQEAEVLYMALTSTLYSCDLQNECDVFQTQTIGNGFVFTGGCVTSSPEYIFIMGGGIMSLVDTVVILNIATNTWISGPSMISKRAYLACAIAHDSLYAIGGKNDSSSYTTTIEKIDILDFINQDWEHFSHLLYETSSSRAVTLENDILLIGGITSNANTMDEIQVIDTLSQIVYSGGYLAYAIRQTSALIVNDVLYAFGGHNGVNSVNTWQYLDLTAIPTTTLPTTNSPTTNHPTNAPNTAIPTSSVPTTNAPRTAMPTTTLPTTNNPTTTNAPSTAVPTASVTTTNAPSTMIPTTSLPTDNPSNSLTYQPSANPTTVTPTASLIYSSTADVSEIQGILVTVALPFKSDLVIANNVGNIVRRTVNVIINDSISDDCLLSDNDRNTTILVTEEMNATIIAVTVINEFVPLCLDEISKVTLTVAFERELHSDLVTNIQQNTGLQISNDDITVVVGDILESSGEQKTISPTAESISESEMIKDENSIVYILAAIGCILACIVIIFCAFCVYKVKTEELEKYTNNGNTGGTTDMNVVYSSSNEPQQTGREVQVTNIFDTNSVSTEVGNTEIETKGYDMTPIDQDSFVVSGDSDQEIEEMEGIDITYTETKSPKLMTTSSEGGEVTKPKSDKHFYPSLPMGMVNENSSQTKNITDWLQNAVKLAQYKNNFVDNGYETMEFVAEISTVDELREIGIVSNKHQLNLLQEIRKWNDNKVSELAVSTQTHDSITNGK